VLLSSGDSLKFPDTLRANSWTEIKLDILGNKAFLWVNNSVVDSISGFSGLDLQASRFWLGGVTLNSRAFPLEGAVDEVKITAKLP